MSETLRKALATMTEILDSIVPAGDELDEPIEKALTAARAALSETEAPGVCGPHWTCSACGSMESFKTIKYDTPGEPIEYDMECQACGATDIRESPEEAASVLGERLDTMVAERDEARAIAKDFEAVATEAEGRCVDIMKERDEARAERDTARHERDRLRHAWGRIAEATRLLRKAHGIIADQFNEDPLRHRCHARNCTTPVKPEMLMCLRHWRMVPRDIQRRVWATYMRPSEAWHQAADAAIAAVAAKECATPKQDRWREAMSYAEQSRDFVQEERDRLRIQFLTIVEDTKTASAATDPGNAGWQAACDCIADLIRMRLFPERATEDDGGDRG